LKVKKTMSSPLNLTKAQLVQSTESTQVPLTKSLNLKRTTKF